jgi:hypothetical protein
MYDVYKYESVKKTLKPLLELVNIVFILRSNTLLK